MYASMYSHRLTVSSSSFTSSCIRTGANAIHSLDRKKELCNAREKGIEIEEEEATNVVRNDRGLEFSLSFPFLKFVLGICACDSSYMARSTAR